jgi:hypothetical protein
MCGITDWLEQDSVEAELCCDGAGDEEMADVHRVEGAAQDAKP